MSDMTKAIVPKSDQLNADDLIGGTNKTITITKVIVADTPQQPVTVHYQGDNGRPYKPCKSMCRVMATIWGNDSKAYVGRSLTLYRDDAVRFGGDAVGGLRISHMSDISKPVTIALTVTKGKRSGFTVQPLRMQQGTTLPDAIANIEQASTADELKAAFTLAINTFKDADAVAEIVEAKDKRKGELK
jgi:hypothetical protein